MQYFLASLLAATASAAVIPRDGAASGPFAIKLQSEDSNYDGLFVSPQDLSSGASIASVSSTPSNQFFYAERTGQLFTTSPAATIPGNVFDSATALSWSYAVSHDVTTGSEKAVDTGMQPVYFSYQARDEQPRKVEQFHTFVVFDIKKNTIRQRGKEDGWFVCSQSQTQDGQTVAALNIVGDAEAREDCSAVTLKTVKVKA